MTLTVFLAAMTVGAALSLSGAVLQSTLRNPLAEPYMLGMVGGGALFSALVTVTGLTSFSPFVLPAASFLGSVVSLLLVCLVALGASRARAIDGGDAQLRSSSSTIVIAGFVVGGGMGSLDMLVMSYAKPEDFEALSKWLYGSLTHVTTFSLLLGSLAALSAAVVLWMFRRELNVMELGHDEAECLGVDTKLTMTVTIGAVALATSVSVALAGAIGFVGLVVPHLVRRMVGGRMQLLLPCCAVVGGVFLATAQSLTNLFPGSVGVGVICAIVSSPVFLLLLASRRNGEGRDV